MTIAPFLAFSSRAPPPIAVIWFSSSAAFEDKRLVSSVVFVHGV